MKTGDNRGHLQVEVAECDLYNRTGTYLDPRRACSAEVNIHVKDWPWSWASINTGVQQ